jgi:N-acetylneuraminic acid mutarotase
VAKTLIDKGLLSTVEKYTVSSDTWSAMAPLHSDRSHHAMVAVASVIYVLGGIASNGEVPLASVLKFDSMQGTWSHVEPMPEGIWLHAACAIGSYIYVFGGRMSASGGKISIFRFNTKTNTWSTSEPMPLLCCYHSVNVLDGNQVYIVGAGDDGKGVLRLDTISGVWSTLGATSNNKHGSTTFVLGGCLYVAAGAILRRRV